MLGLSIDPGMSNGVCLFSYGQTTPFKVEKLWQFSGGAEGLTAFLGNMDIRARPNSRSMSIGQRKLDTLVVEKFTPRQSEGFSLTRDSVEPLRGEGVLIGRGFAPHINWGQPSQQYFMGASTLPLAIKKKLAHEFLKRHDLYVTGKVVSGKDADDAISAELHAIAWLRRVRHMPTLHAYFGEGMSR